MSEATLKLLNEDGKTTSLSIGARPISEYTDYYAIPILYLSGNTAGMTKDNKVTLDYIFNDFSGTCTLKWQGSSSSKLPKKNYTITLDEAVEIVNGWGAQKKYCLKANYVDSSHARNVVCAKLWGQMVKSRTTANERLNALPNGGAIDGFPIIVSLNGYFHGLYTWNIPKDAWMFGMDGTGQQAILCAERDNNNKATLFKGLATFVEDPNTGEPDFSVEYSSDDQTDWVLESVNRLITAVMNSDGTNIENDIAPYLDLDSAIDYYIHAVLTANYDGRHRNYLLSTYDGVKWFFTGYDMDVVLGLRAMGAYFYPAHQDMTFEGLASNHALFGLIWEHMRPRLIARYKKLRASVMSVENVANMFVEFVADIPLPVYVDDVRLWNDIPSSSANNLTQIISYYDLRCHNADKWIGGTGKEYSFVGKKVMFFGDSITYNESMYISNLLESTGMVRIANFALNGARLANYSDTQMNGNPVEGDSHDNTVPNQVQKLLNSVSNYDVPDIIIVSAGTNGGTSEAEYDESQYTDENDTYIELDAVNLTKFSGAIRWIYEKLILYYPNAKIFFATPIQSYGGGSRTFQILSAKAECIRQNCERLSTPCIDAFRKSGIYGRYEVQSANGKYLKDGLHPNANGAVMLAKCYHRELANALIDQSVF